MGHSQSKPDSHCGPACQAAAIRRSIDTDPAMAPTLGTAAQPAGAAAPAAAIVSTQEVGADPAVAAKPAALSATAAASGLRRDVNTPYDSLELPRPVADSDAHLVVVGVAATATPLPGATQAATQAALPPAVQTAAPLVLSVTAPPELAQPAANTPLPSATQAAAPPTAVEAVPAGATAPAADGVEMMMAASTPLVDGVPRGIVLVVARSAPTNSGGGLDAGSLGVGMAAGGVLVALVAFVVLAVKRSHSAKRGNGVRVVVQSSESMA